MKSNRRDFLKQMTVITAAAAMPTLAATSCSTGKKKVTPRKVKPGEKVRLACVGIGFRGGEIIKKFEATELCDIVALCDINMGAEHTLETIESGKMTGDLAIITNLDHVEKMETEEFILAIRSCLEKKLGA